MGYLNYFTKIVAKRGSVVKVLKVLGTISKQN